MEKLYANKSGKHTTGLIIGKFMPPHKGHEYLIDFARNYVDELHVLVCSLKSEPIPGNLRYKWMKQMFPDVDVQHMWHDEFPSEPKDDINFWKLWKDAISGYLSEKPAEYLFACESYGVPLAKLFGMKYIPVSHTRELVPISGTEVRNDPIKNWEYIPPIVRPYYAKRVCVFGPESTGKSVLAEKLAKRFDTVHVKEYARSLLDLKEGDRNGECDYKDISLIAKGQIASEEALARQANRVLFCDTDLLATKVW
ncbi:MAG: AAA family ATPase, partial [archaeon]